MYLNEAIRATGVSLLEKENGTQQMTVPKTLRDNGLPWKGSEPLVWFYFKELNFAIVMTEAMEKTIRGESKAPDPAEAQE